jgi:hypothetical protein
MYNLCISAIVHLELKYKIRQFEKIIVVLNDLGEECLFISPIIYDINRLRGFRPLIVYYDEHVMKRKEIECISKWRNTNVLNLENSLILIQE